MRILSVLLMLSLCVLPFAGCKKGGSSKKKKNNQSDDQNPDDGNNSGNNGNNDPNSSQPNPQNQNTITSWSELQGKNLAIQQNISEENAKFQITFIYETYFQAGAPNPDVEKTPNDVNGTYCFLRFKGFTFKSSANLSSSSVLRVSKVMQDTKTAYTEAEADIEEDDSHRVNKIICRKHPDGGQINAQDLATAFGAYLQIQTN